MSEFIEIDDYTLRVSDIKHATAVKKGVVVCFTNGETGRFDEPYESVRDKLMGKPVKPVVDLRGEFADQVVFMLERLGHKDAAAAVRVHYRSLMLSETEGAG